MPVQGKCKSGELIKNGSAVVSNGRTNSSYADLTEIQSWASGDSLQLFQTLDGRYKVDPSGWSS